MSPSYAVAMIRQYDKIYRALSLERTLHNTDDHKAAVRHHICLIIEYEGKCIELAGICNLTAISHHTLAFEQCSSPESSSPGSKTYVISSDLSQRSRMYQEIHMYLQYKHIGHARKLGALWNHQHCSQVEICIQTVS